MRTTISGGAVMKRISVGKLKPSEVLKGTIDGAYFRKSKEAESNEFQVDFISFDEHVKLEHSEDIGADNWVVLLFEEIDDPNFNYNVEYFRAYILDPITFMRNQIAAGSQGILIKRSIPGYNIIQEIMSKLKLDDVKAVVIKDFEQFKKTYN
jgi:hypothetical protein